MRRIGHVKVLDMRLLRITYELVNHCRATDRSSGDVESIDRVPAVGFCTRAGRFMPGCLR
ncbi:hypothetical protein DDJ76_13465 [Mycobacteroides abscessus]|nr:hypothetical protein DDJ61_03530 [Mycobacteroides abscessus]PVA83797.1 hypothetical protein DDJ76_13465 [Mycobacteroides abscessus]RIR96058.1 hypothetical protein D2E50_00035 [Mycobacteroides abscessus]RIS08043.1 hypothetical protein D2E63_15825 [Mycobacteroides abscessus]RIS15876.1 hypothetical protein D2E69_16595 [Mycobacteroides abscessus]